MTVGRLFRSRNDADGTDAGAACARLPGFACARHRTRDGGDYPCRLAADKIPVPSHIATMADSYAELSAGDRRYKRGLSEKRVPDLCVVAAGAVGIDHALCRVWGVAVQAPDSLNPAVRGVFNEFRYNLRADMTTFHFASHPAEGFRRPSLP